MSKNISKLVFIIVLAFIILIMDKANAKATDGEDANMGAGTEKIEFSDFSKVKLEIENAGTAKRDMFSKQQLKISNYKLASRETSSKSDFFYTITQSADKPKFDENDTKITTNRADKYTPIGIKTDKTTIFRLEEYTELKGELYFWLVEKFKDNEGKIQVDYVIEGKKIEKLQNPQYAGLFTISFFSNTYTQLLFNTPHNDKIQRQFQLKIGKITNEETLKKIKSNTSDSWSELMTFSKNAASIYNKTLTTNGTSNLSYQENNAIVSSSQLEDKEYYYIYALFDDENGKYAPIEAVTISQASIRDIGTFYLFLLGSEEFQWKEFGENKEPETHPSGTKAEKEDEKPAAEDDKEDKKESEQQEEKETPKIETITKEEEAEKKDNTTAPNEIPQTGENNNIIIVMGLIIILVAIVSIKLYEKYNIKF